VHIPFDSLQGFIESGDLKPIFLFTKEKVKGFENVPIPADVGHPELADLVSMQILVFGPPGISRETTKVLRDTFMQAVQDPKYLEWAKSVKRDVVPLHGDEVGPLVKKNLDSYMKYKDLVK
jgi:tripartite-type tricarboxylate transporter receptor subunit TctC